MARSATKRGTGKDREYLAWLHTLPCVVCQFKGLRQASPTEAAHCGERGLSQKCPDRKAAPLCGCAHHREGSFSIHKLGKHFWAHHKMDRDEVLARLQRDYETRMEAA